MDFNKKLEDAVRSLASNPVQKMYVDNMLKSPETSKIKNSLTDAEKQKILSKFNQMDQNEIKRRLSSADLSKFSKMNTNDIIRLLKQI